VYIGSVTKNPFNSNRLTIFCAALCFFTTLASTAAAVEFAAHGYYRTRGNVYQNLDMHKSGQNHRFGLIAYNQMRLRVEPMVKINDWLFVQAQADILDNIVFGTKNTKQIQIDSPIVGTQTLPPGAGSISLVGSGAGENEAINIRRVYMDILTPVGKLRIGRQPSHWGLGIFQNDGNEIQGDFGDTADRVLFMSQYEFGDGGSLAGGLLWDIAYDAQFDPRIYGLSGDIKSAGQDTQQYAGLLLYERDEFGIGAFGGLRRRSGGNSTTMTALNPFGNSVDAGIDGNTMVYFGDVYARFSYEEYDFRAEYVYLGGKMSTGLAINAVPFAVWSGETPNTTAGVIELKPDMDVQVNMAAFEATGAYKWGGEWGLKAGFAQGDASPLTQRITQYGFRPDYQIALLMFHVPLGTSPALMGCSATDGPGCATPTKLAGGVPITGNFINNAYYVTAEYTHHFDLGAPSVNDFSVGVKGITAWAQKNPVELNFQAIFPDQPTLPNVTNSSKWYGAEVDLTVTGKFYDHLIAMLEAGVLIPGGAYDVRVDNATLGWVSQITEDKAQISYGGRLTLMVEF